MKIERATAVACLILGSLALSARPADAQIAKIVDNSGRSFFVNSNTASVKLAPASKAHTNIYLPGEISFTGLAHPAVDMDRDGVEKLVREAAGRHRLDPALVRAVIETESNWNPKAYSHKAIWCWRRITPEKARWTAPTEFLHSAKHAITCRRFRTPISGRGPAACLTRLSTRTRSTGTSHPKDASYLGTTENSNRFWSHRFSSFGLRRVRGPKARRRSASGSRALVTVPYV